eukprot:scaffold294658_cov33-Tisochrysis_lutea.AAC.5
MAAFYPLVPPLVLVVIRLAQRGARSGYARALCADHCPSHGSWEVKYLGASISSNVSALARSGERSASSARTEFFDGSSAHRAIEPLASNSTTLSPSCCEEVRHGEGVDAPAAMAGWASNMGALMQLAASRLHVAQEDERAQ